MFYSESFHEPQELSASSYRSYEIQFTATDMVRTGIRNEFFCKSSASDRQIRRLSPPSAEGAAGVVHAKYFTVLSSRYVTQRRNCPRALAPVQTIPRIQIRCLEIFLSARNSCLFCQF